MLQDRRKFKNKYMLAGSLIALFALLSFLFPYICDDWAWGSSIGEERLATFFSGYNGRYLGNLLVMAMTRSKFLTVALKAISFFGCCWICYKYAQKQTTGVMLFAAILLLVMPSDMFTQVVVWTSGYANYVPSALITGLYILMIRNLPESLMQPAENKIYLSVSAALMGVCGALFVESVTLLNIVLGLAVVIYSKMKYGKARAYHLTFLCGTVLGTVLMFSNSAYSRIAAGNDTYRSTAESLSDLIYMIGSHLRKCIDFVVFSNYIMCTLISAMLVCLVGFTIVHMKSKTQKMTAAVGTATNILCLIVIILDNILEEGAIQSPYLKILIGVLYALSIVTIIVVCVARKSQLRMLFPLCCVPVSIAPLLVVNPLGARCLFVTYLLFMIFCADLFCYLLYDVIGDKKVTRIVDCGMIVGFMILAIVYIAIFGKIHCIDTKRNEFAKLQSDNGEKTVIVCELPYSRYQHYSDPSVEPWDIRYKLFYGLNEDVTFEFVDCDELDEAIEAYKNENRINK